MNEVTPDILAQEIYCHNCDGYVKFEIDLSLNGNHVLNCPKCGHEHCRVVKDGVITSDRWDSRNRSYRMYVASYRSNYTVAYQYKGSSYLHSSWTSSSIYSG